MWAQISFGIIEGNGAMNENCQKYSVDLSAYFDGELNGKKQTLLKEHLRACEDCRKELGKMEKLSISMKNFPPGPVGNHRPLKDFLNKFEEEEMVGTEETVS